MRISDVLRVKGEQVVTVTPDTDVRHLLTVLAEHRIGAVVVSHDGTSVEGIASERDIVRALAQRGTAVLSEAITAIYLAGSNELQRWLDDTSPGEERSRNLFLVRIFFGDRTSRERLAALLDEYEAAARTRIDLLAALVDRLAGRPESVFRRSTAMFGLRAEQAKVDWVTDVRPILLAATAPEEETLTACGGG